MTQVSIQPAVIQAHVLDTPADPWLTPAAPFEVVLDDVRYSWNNRDIWRVDARLDFRKLRGRVPVVGRSGNGKTTLLYIIAGLKWPLSGTITWRLSDGSEWSWGRSGALPVRADWAAFRRRIGFAFQDSTLLPHLTVGENLRYPLILDGVPRRDAEMKARDILDRMLIDHERKDRWVVDDMLAKFPMQLSGGQRKRAALAQAMMRDPDVLFADEPAGSLDHKTAAEVRLCILGWLDRLPGQRAFVWVTHHRSDPAEYGAEAEIEPPAANSPDPPNRLIPLPVKPKPPVDTAA